LFDAVVVELMVHLPRAERLEQIAAHLAGELAGMNGDLCGRRHGELLPEVGTQNKAWLDIGSHWKSVCRVMRMMIMLWSFCLMGSPQLQAANASAISATSSGTITIDQRAVPRMIMVSGGSFTIHERRWMYGNHTNGFGLEQYRILQGSNSVTLLLSGKDVKVMSPGGERFVRYTDLVLGSHRLKLRLPAMGVMGVMGLGGFLIMMTGWTVVFMVYEFTAKPRRSEKGAA
jgi:hypothetical protein